MIGYEITAERAVKQIKQDQEHYGLQRSGLLACMHGAFQYDAEEKGDHVAFRACVLIRQAMPILTNA